MNRSEYWHPKFDKYLLEVEKVLEMGAQKHGAHNWVEHGKKMSHTENHDSMFHHIAQSYSGISHDNESGLIHIAHLGCRAMMEYVCMVEGLHGRDKL